MSETAGWSLLHEEARPIHGKRGRFRRLCGPWPGTAVWFPLPDSQIFGLLERSFAPLAAPASGRLVAGWARGYRQMVMPAPHFQASAANPSRPLTAFEHLMLADARPGHPMNFFLECEVAGPLSLDRLKAAVAAAVQRHPLLRSRVAWQRGRPHWLPPDVEPIVAFATADAWRPIDLARESGLRLMVLPAIHAAEGHALGAFSAEPRQRIVMVAHHAALDGVAAGEFFGDLWACYHGHEPPRFSDGRRRGGGGTHSAGSARATGGASLAPSIWPFASFRPRPLIPIRSDAETVTAAATRTAHAPPPPYATISLARDTTARLRALAAANGWSLNDLVVAAVMQSANGWNERAGGRAGNVRITLPVSLRAIGSRGPARNDLGYAFLDRTAAQCRDRSSLVAGLAQASRWIVDSLQCLGNNRLCGTKDQRIWNE